MNWEIVTAVLLGYFLGSLPFALIIGKVFYKIDIRQHGSGNLGGGNAGRVLGKRAGLSVMTCDILKVILTIFIMSRISDRQEIWILAGFSTAIGHCFPMFARFKGGKAVAAMYGFLFGMGVFGGYGLKMFLIPLAVFLIVLYFGKIISVASILSAMFITGYVMVTGTSGCLKLALLFFTVIIIVRHEKNLKRLIRHEENKISWM